MRRVKCLGHVQINNGRMKGNDCEINTAQTPKRLMGVWLFRRKTFTDSILSN